MLNSGKVDERFVLLNDLCYVLSSLSEFTVWMTRTNVPNFGIYYTGKTAPSLFSNESFGTLEVLSHWSWQMALIFECMSTAGTRHSSSHTITWYCYLREHYFSWGVPPSKTRCLWKTRWQGLKLNGAMFSVQSLKSPSVMSSFWDAVLAYKTSLVVIRYSWFGNIAT